MGETDHSFISTQTLSQYLDDPNEIRIRQILKDQMLSTDWAKNALGSAQSQLFDFFKLALASKDDPSKIRRHHLHLLSELSAATKAHLAPDSKPQDAEPDKGLVVVTNHLGIGKLVDFVPSDLGLPKDFLGVDEPFPIRYASLWPLAQYLKRTLFETAVELPQPVGDIQRACEAVLVPDSGKDRLKQLEENLKKLLAKVRNPLVVMYPEGGTSGKRNAGGPYSLVQFRTGAFVAASHFDLPVMPVCQYFDPNTGFEVKTFPIVDVSNVKSHEEFQEIAAKVHGQMQEWFDQRQAA